MGFKNTFSYHILFIMGFKNTYSYEILSEVAPILAIINGLNGSLLDKYLCACNLMSEKIYLNLIYDGFDLATLSSVLVAENLSNAII